ncbi:unnamed protein product [Caretta caretta]
MVGLRESFGHPLVEKNEESRLQSDEEFDFKGFTEEEVGRTDMKWMQELCQQLSGLGATVLPLNIKSWTRGDNEAEEICLVAESLTDDQILQAVRPNNITEAEELAFAVEEGEEEEVDVIPTSTATIASLETALRWFETQDVEPIKIMQLRSLLQFPKRKRHSHKKQKQLTHLFFLKKN